MCQADNPETQLLTRMVCWTQILNKVIGKFMTIKTSLYDTENV